MKTSEAPPPEAKPSGGPPPDGAFPVGKGPGAKPAETGAADKAEKQDKPAAASVNPTFRYDTKAQRMIMMVHDQSTGSVVQQIPSEAALRQYEEAAKLARTAAPAKN